MFLSILGNCHRLHGGGQRVSTRGCDGNSRDAGSSCPTLGMDQTRRPVTCSPAVSYIPLLAALEESSEGLPAGRALLSPETNTAAIILEDFCLN